MKVRRSIGLLPVVAVLGVVAAGCALPAPGPVDKVIPLSDTCNLQVRLGSDAEGSYVAARTSGLCFGPNEFEGTPSQSVGGIRIETTEGTQQCVWSGPWGDFGPGNCSTYEEGVPGTSLALWYLATAPGSMVTAEVIFAYYDSPSWFSVPVFP